MEEQMPTELVDKITRGECVLFLGAGATRDAGGPTGKELALLLANNFFKKDIPTDDLTSFCDILTALPDIDREDVDSAIVAALKKIQPSAGHRLIPSFCWRAIFTTNYDRLVEIAYDTSLAGTGQQVKQDLVPVLSIKDLVPRDDRTKLGLFKLHGCISAINRDSPLVLTSRDYERTRKKREQMLRWLRALAADHCILFVGYSFADGVITRLLNEIEFASPYNSRRRMYSITGEISASAAAYLESQRITCISTTFTDAFQQLDGHVDSEARKLCMARRIPQIEWPSGQVLHLPNALRVALDAQVEILNPGTYPQRDGKRYLGGLPPTFGDIRNNNDIVREQDQRLKDVVVKSLGSDQYLRPLVVVVGPGGAGKSTVAMRVAYEIHEESRAIVCRLKAHELWKGSEIVEFARRANAPCVFVADDIEVHACFKALCELRHDLSVERLPVVLLASCQKPVWNSIQKEYPLQEVVAFDLEGRLSREEAEALISKLVEHGMLDVPSPKELQNHVAHITEDCEGHLIVAMMELVRHGTFREIVLREYENLSVRAREAYVYVALLHQHGISVPDYLLNHLTVNDWQVFTDEVIRLESELIIIQDINYTAGRLYFRTRHPVIAKLIVDTVVPKHEDRVRMYRRIVESAATSQEDLVLLLGILTSRSVRGEIREPKYIEELLEKALDLFPQNRTLILHLGKFESQSGNLDKGRQILEWGRSLEPRDSYIIHELGVNAERRARQEVDSLAKEAAYQEAVSLFRRKQEIDPLSHYGYTSESRVYIWRARNATDESVRLDYLSSAEHAIRRGMDLVREDQKGFLRESRIELSEELGNPNDVVASVEEIESKGNVHYASTFHLLASCLLELGKEEAAVEALERGLAVFPGDPQIVELFLSLSERQFYCPRIRRRCREWLENRVLAEKVGVRAQFLQGVMYYYDNQFHKSFSKFDDIRQKLFRRAPTRIRLYVADENGQYVDKRGNCRRKPAGRLEVTDVETGHYYAIDNVAKWESLEKPLEVIFHLGFGLAGP